MALDDGLSFGGAPPPQQAPVPVVGVADPTLDDGLSFSGLPIGVPPDPTGEEWRGATGPPGPTGATGPAGASGTVWIGDIPPTDTATYQMWFSSTVLTLFIWYDDGNSSQWVAAFSGVV